MFIKKKELLFKCKQIYKFIECLEHFLRKKYQTNDQNEYLVSKEANKNEITRQEKVPIGEEKEKRNANNKDELLTFFRNAIAKNMRLKSNIKTTRF